MAAEPRVRFEGCSTTPQYLTVYFTIGDRQAKRVREVKVPYGSLLDVNVVEGVNAEASRRLKVLWEDRQDPLPWE